VQSRERPGAQEIREDTHGHHEPGEEPERRIHAAQDAAREQTSEAHVAEDGEEAGESLDSRPDTGEDSRELEPTDGE